MLPLLVSLAFAAALPSIDEPVRLDQRAPADGAVVFGVETYLRGAGVPFARNDANAFYDFLVYTRGIPADRVRLVTKDASAAVIRTEVEALGRRVAGGGTAWVYFAGHGAARLSDGERMVLGDDVMFDERYFDAGGVAVEDLETLAGSGGGQVMMLVDACFTGKSRDGAGATPEGRAGAPLAAYRVRRSSALVWTAAEAGEVAGPLASTQHGAFTYFALGALRGWADGERDGTRDGTVTGEEAELYVAKAMRTLQLTGQSPKLWMGGEAGLSEAEQVGAAERGTAAKRAMRLSIGVKEAAPSLAREVAPVPPVADDLSSELAELVRARAVREEAERGEAARARAVREEAERREAAITAKLEAERLRKVAEAAAALKRRATADWAVAKPEVVAGGPEGAKALELFLAMYGASEGVAEVAEARGYAATTAKTWTGPRSGYPMIRVDGGSFTMGSPTTEPGRSGDEGPVSATVQGYWLGSYEVTQAQWRSEMGDGPEGRTQFMSGTELGSCAAYEGVSLVGAELPMVCVSWVDAVTFANRLSKRDGLKEAYRVSGATVTLVPGSDGYRLPSEAEWEHAARAGTRTVYVGTSEASEVCRYGNVADATAEKQWPSRDAFTCTDGAAGPSSVGRYAANGWGFHDMVGNVWEWTGDWYAETLTASGAQRGSYRVFRGGRWNASPAYARVAYRDRLEPAARRVSLGLRLARSIP